MNNLSWLLYWADTLPHLATALGLVCTITALFCGAMTILFFTAGFGAWDHDPEYTARFRYFPYIAPFLAVLALSSCLVPSKDTFYLIAASEAGGQVLQTPEMGKVRAVINKWLDDAAAPDDKDDHDKK